MKIINILLIFLISSCIAIIPDRPKPRSEVYDHDVEIFCPNIGRRVLIETSDKQEVIESIQKFLHQKQSQGTSEDYTVLRFSDKSSLFIKKIPPEVMIRCHIRNVRPKIVKTYYHY